MSVRRYEYLVADDFPIEIVPKVNPYKLKKSEMSSPLI